MLVPGAAATQLFATLRSEDAQRAPELAALPPPPAWMHYFSGGQFRLLRLRDADRYWAPGLTAEQRAFVAGFWPGIAEGYWSSPQSRIVPQYVWVQVAEVAGQPLLVFYAGCFQAPVGFRHDSRYSLVDCGPRAAGLLAGVPETYRMVASLLCFLKVSHLSTLVHVVYDVTPWPLGGGWCPGWLPSVEEVQLGYPQMVPPLPRVLPPAAAFRPRSYMPPDPRPATYADFPVERP